MVCAFNIKFNINIGGTMSIKQNIRALMFGYKLKITDLSEMSDVPYQQLRNYFDDKGNLSLDNFEKIVKAFPDVDYGYYFTGELKYLKKYFERKNYDVRYKEENQGERHSNTNC